MEIRMDCMGEGIDWFEKNYINRITHKNYNIIMFLCKEKEDIKKVTERSSPAFFFVLNLNYRPIYCTQHPLYYRKRTWRYSDEGVWDFRRIYGICRWRVYAVRLWEWVQRVSGGLSSMARGTNQKIKLLILKRLFE